MLTPMSTPEPFAKTIVDFLEGESASAVYLPIEPYGLALFVAPDTSLDSHNLLDEVAAVWEELWPPMRTYLDTTMKAYGVEAELGRDEFIGSLGRMTPTAAFGGRSDIMIRLEFEEPPLWDFFVKGSAIAHSQPVF